MAKICNEYFSIDPIIRRENTLNCFFPFAILKRALAAAAAAAAAVVFSFLLFPFGRCNDFANLNF